METRAPCSRCLLWYICGAVDDVAFADIICSRCEAAGLCDSCIQSGAIGMERACRITGTTVLETCTRCLDPACTNYQCGTTGEACDYYHVCRPPIVAVAQVSQYHQPFQNTTLLDLYNGQGRLAISPTMHVERRRHHVSDWTLAADQALLSTLFGDLIDTSASILHHTLNIYPWTDTPVKLLLASMYDRTISTAGGNINVDRVAMKWAICTGSDRVQVTLARADVMPASLSVLKASAAAMGALLVIVTNVRPSFLEQAGVPVIVLGHTPLEGASRCFTPMCPDMVGNIFMA